MQLAWTQIKILLFPSAAVFLLSDCKLAQHEVGSVPFYKAIPTENKESMFMSAHADVIKLRSFCPPMS